MTGVRFHRSARTKGADGKEVLSLLPKDWDFMVPAEMLVFAIGYDVEEKDLSGEELTLSKGVLQTDRTAATEGVFAAGDLTGGRYIVDAVGEGKRAALMLHNALREEAAT